MHFFEGGGIFSPRQLIFTKKITTMKKIFVLCLLVMTSIHFSSFQASAKKDYYCLEHMMDLPTDFYFDFDDFDNPFNCAFSTGACLVCTQLELI